MPNYSLESEGHYNPYAYTGFQDAIDAVLKQQDEIDDAYAELKDKAFAIGSLIDPNDKDAYNMYQTYMNMLDSGVNDLMSNGLNYNSRRHMQDIKSLYNRYMTPIANAYAARAAEVKSQQDAYDKDNSIRYEREAAATNLSDYLRNPNLHARSASGRNIMANVSTMLQNVALGAAHGDENSRGILRRMFGNNIDYEYVYQHGFDLNTIADAIANIDDPKYAALKRMVVQAERDEGYDEWADQATKDYMHDWALSGLSAAIGRTEVSERRDTQAYMNAQEAMQKRLWDYEHPEPEPTSEQTLSEYLATKGNVFKIVDNAAKDEGNFNDDNTLVSNKQKEKYYKKWLAEKWIEIKQNSDGTKEIVKTSKGQSQSEVSKNFDAVKEHAHILKDGSVVWTDMLQSSTVRMDLNRAQRDGWTQMLNNASLQGSAKAYKVTFDKEGYPKQKSKPDDLRGCSIDDIYLDCLTGKPYMHVINDKGEDKGIYTIPKSLATNYVTELYDAAKQLQVYVGAANLIDYKADWDNNENAIIEALEGARQAVVNLQSDIKTKEDNSEAAEIYELHNPKYKQ